LLWSDPNEQEESWALSYCGAGYTFGSKVVEDFHHINGTELIVHSRLFPINLKGYKEWFQVALKKFFRIEWLLFGPRPTLED
jgi:diadenosine tetraphosphatase ApaH/serine/threonine PP2A family protein phosphatase